VEYSHNVHSMPAYGSYGNNIEYNIFCCSVLILVYMYVLLQSMYYLKNFSFLNLECKNWQVLKETKKYKY